MHKQTLRCVLNLKPKEEFKKAKILQIKGSTKAGNKLINEWRTIPNDNDIINIKKKINHKGTMMQNKQITISRRGMKTNVKQLRSEALKPSSRGLFKSINGFMKKADMSGMFRINIARRLRHKDLLMKPPMKKSIRYI